MPGLLSKAWVGGRVIWGGPQFSDFKCTGGALCPRHTRADPGGRGDTVTIVFPHMGQLRFLLSPKTQLMSHNKPYFPLKILTRKPTSCWALCARCAETPPPPSASPSSSPLEAAACLWAEVPVALFLIPVFLSFGLAGGYSLRGVYVPSPIAPPTQVCDSGKGSGAMRPRGAPLAPRSCATGSAGAMRLRAVACRRCLSFTAPTSVHRLLCLPFVLDRRGAPTR